MLRDEEWEKYSSKKWKRAAAWHRNFIEAFLHDLHWNFEEQVSSGAAQLFARPRSPLAPFERIFPDQWNFMKLEPHEIEGRFIAWNDPKNPYWDPNRPMSARGPDGERIYSIYVAPGELRGVKNEREKCRQWLKPFMQNNPSRCPITVGELVDLLAAECSNEPKKVIRYWALEEIKEIGPPDWIKEGPPPKKWLLK